MKCHIYNTSADKKVYWSFAILLSVLAGIMYYLTPVCCDDVWYLSESVGKQGSWTYFASTFKNCIAHWQWDTGRLCNTVAAPFLALFPRYIYAVATSILIALIYIIGITITNTKWISLSSAIWMAVVSFVVPWLDYMFTIIFSINYIWGSALGLSVFYLFIKNDNRMHRCAGYNICLLLLSFITGWWHEGLSAPLVGGLAVYLIVDKKITLQRMLILGGLVSGLIFIALMPAFWMMTESRQSNIIKSVLLETLVHLIVFNCLFYIYIILIGIITCVKKMRRKLFSTRKATAFQLCVMTFGVVSFAIYIKYYNGPRTGMFSQIFCGLGILDIINSQKTRPNASLSRFVLISVFVLSFASWVKSVCVQKGLSEEIYDVTHLAHAEKASTGRATVFYDHTPMSFGIDFFKPSYKVLNTKFGLRGIELLPTSLKNFSLENDDLIHCSDSSLVIYKNRIIYVGPSFEKRMDIVLENSTGNNVLSRTQTRDFITKDGDTVTYVIPHVQSMGSEMHIIDAHLVR